MLKFEYYHPVRIIFGSGELVRLAELARPFGNRVMLAVGKESARKEGVVDRAKDMLTKDEFTLSIYDGIQPNLSADSVNLGGEKAKKERIEVIVALGGGSVMDAGKAISLAATHPGAFWEYRLTGEKGISQIQDILIPVITVPTTAGTGSEISPAALISKGGRKEIIVSPYMFPKVALVDPQLTVSLPPNLTAQIGADALVQSIEAYVSANSQSVSDLYAKESIKLVVKNIKTAFSNGKDLGARESLSLAGILSSKALNLAGAGAAHALSNPLSGRYNMGHGLAVSILLPAVMEFNLDANYRKYAHIAELLGENISGLSDEEAAKKSVEAVRRLLNELGLAHTLSEFGVSEKDIEDFAPEAFNPDMDSNPKKLTLDEVKSIYRKVLRVN